MALTFDDWGKRILKTKVKLLEGSPNGSTCFFAEHSKLKVSSFSNEGCVKKSVEKIEEISLFNNDQTGIVECIEKRERDQEF